MSIIIQTIPFFHLRRIIETITFHFSYSEFMTYHRSKKNKTYIIKPDNSCQGKGIMLTKTPKVFRKRKILFGMNIS